MAEPTLHHLYRGLSSEPDSSTARLSKALRDVASVNVVWQWTHPQLSDRCRAGLSAAPICERPSGRPLEGRELSVQTNVSDSTTKEMTMSNNAKYGDEVKSTGESHTEFGRSVESKAQIADACRASSDSGAETLNVYRLVPIAAKSDPRWQSALNQGEVVVAARTSGDARIVASACELDYMEVDAAPAEGVSTSDASAFRDEKLYTVIEVEHAKAGLVRGLLEGEISVVTIKPVQI